MNRQDMARRLEAVEAVLQPVPTMKDIFTPAEEAFFLALLSGAPREATIGSTLAADGSAMAARVRAKLEAMPRHVWPSFVLYLFPGELDL